MSLGQYLMMLGHVMIGIGIGIALAGAIVYFYLRRKE
jgi:hypothetical protein